MCIRDRCRDGELVAQSFQNSGLTHSRTLLPMVHDLLKNCGESLDKVDAVSYTHLHRLVSGRTKSHRMTTAASRPPPTRRNHRNLTPEAQAINTKIII